MGAGGVFDEIRSGFADLSAFWVFEGPKLDWAANTLPAGALPAICRAFGAKFGLYITVV
jgi:hypothetical protein